MQRPHKAKPDTHHSKTPQTGMQHAALLSSDSVSNPIQRASHRLIQHSRIWMQQTGLPIPFNPWSDPNPHPSSLLNTLIANLSFNSKHSSAADAAVLIAITDEAEPNILFTKRASTLNNHAGEISFPGGKRDPSDISNSSVALREAFEEVGIHPHSVKLLGDLPVTRAKNGMTVKAIVGLIPADLQLNLSLDEIDYVFYVPLRHFLTTAPVRHFMTYRGQSVNVPAYLIEHNVIWGLTGRLTAQLMAQGFDFHIYWPLMYRDRQLLKLLLSLGRKIKPVQSPSRDNLNSTQNSAQNSAQNVALKDIVERIESDSCLEIDQSEMDQHATPDAIQHENEHTQNNADTTGARK